MFSIGDRIVHPLHGAGVIDSIEEKRISGVVRSYYVMKLPTGGMVVMIPTDSCDAIGVRQIMSSEEAESVLESIPDLDADMTNNWSRRYRENMQRIKSGDLYEVAAVVKGLMLREAAKGLSTGERKMLYQAKQILISEIVLAENTTYDDVEARLNSAME